MSKPSTAPAVLLLALLAAAAPCRAGAAACCMSATSFGVGRLTIWEDWAVGLRAGHARSLGQWDQAGELQRSAPGWSEGLTTLEPWAIVRLHERVQLQARLPVVVNDRTQGEQRQVAGGLGDAAAGVRLEAIPIGWYLGVPSLAFTAGVIAPTGTSPDETEPPLYAGATGRGAWGATLAAEAEYAWLPWFVRLDAGGSWWFPTTQAATGQEQQLGAGLQVALSAGRELVPDRLVLAAAVSAEWEAPLQVGGAEVAGSSARAASLAASLSWTADPHWTVVATLSNNAWPVSAGANRDARTGFTLGVRHGHF